MQESAKDLHTFIYSISNFETYRRNQDCVWKI